MVAPHASACATMRAMCCVVALLAFLGPRLAIFLLWLFTTYTTRAFDNFLLPFLGFLFLPCTTIALPLPQNEFGGPSGIGLGLIALGLLAGSGRLGGGA